MLTDIPSFSATLFYGKAFLLSNYVIQFLYRYSGDFSYAFCYDPAGKTEITGIIYEPWHYRYVGVELATELYESGLTLEEYFDELTMEN